MHGLDGRVAVITGGARGQGRSHATTLAGAGADIVVCDVLSGPTSTIEGLDYPLASADDLEETVQAVELLGRRCVAVTADVRDFAAMRDVAEAAIDAFGRIDVAAANAGIATSECSTPSGRCSPT